MMDPYKCVDIPGLEGGQVLQIWDCNGHPNQNWGYDYDSMSIYASDSASDASLCLDIPGGAVEQGAKVWTWACDHTLHQQQWWVPPRFGGWSIQSGLEAFTACFDLAGQIANNGSPIQMYECNGFESQQWFFDAGSWTIRYAVLPSKCVDVPGGDFRAGNKLWLWDCNGAGSQQFGYDADMRTIYAAASDASMCIDVPGGDASNNVQLWLWDCNGLSSQDWIAPSLDESAWYNRYSL